MTEHKRSPEVEARIQRLLNSIKGAAAASSVQMAWSNISAAVQAAEQAETSPWKIDPLTAKEVKKFDDGSIRVPQLGHWLYINKNGAFGILDLWSQDFVVVKAGADGVAFYKPI
ncbi:hypothetical protein ACFOY5_20980 [Massilia aurea]|uniref:hypothetical protein n=1 Tax=Massilia aurea TaxID=373040 RepID=UPI00216211D1|nr:hypothetical protein [Massilia aurea]MCS0709979.1 hypothetical protein [Massilia aurea]